MTALIISWCDYVEYGFLIASPFDLGQLSVSSYCRLKLYRNQMGLAMKSLT